ncbi:GATA zinc finger transcription factor [Paxillus involutus ATCC 200175]|uniref:GATA zinc finger transcription factor n=1 Tax=Paxillus involutus ATCC 200175 TaxID=664439 RepID=A0A0C9TXH3_PAXIN|nr:GATA zinc finger transcription factor [Paxillus involutus ATCC 200175]
MPSIVNLKFKGNKSFVAFSNLSDSESLTKTWKVCTKVASYLEQGQRLENLSWRLWHLQNLIVDSDNAKSKREFKKLSKIMGDKLDKEKGRSIEELGAPDFKHNASVDLIRQRAAEKERNREASQNARPGTIKRMQFTFSIDQPAPAGPNVGVTKPDLKPSAEFKETATRRGRQAARAHVAGDEPNDHTINMNTEMDASAGSRKRKSFAAFNDHPSLKFPSLFSSDFGPSALLFPQPSFSNAMNYGEDVTNTSSRGFSIVRPTIELPLDELLSNVDTEDNHSVLHQGQNEYKAPADLDVVMQDTCLLHIESQPPRNNYKADSRAPPLSQAVKESTPRAVPPKVGPSAGTRGNTPNGRPNLTVKTQTSPVTRSSGPGATATSVNPAVVRGNGNNPAPGGVKAECSNCGATHTPLWRRGLNDELNCNACGLYCKLHKRPRPKTMRANHGEGRTQVAPRQEMVDVIVGTAQCYNCHTTATPLWRKDDEGKTVCNACGLYYKLHGAARPISMKSDVIRKRSRHDARRTGPDSSETPSASPGASRRASPTVEPSPTLAPDSTTQPTYDYNEETTTQSTSSELMGALGQDGQNNVYSGQTTYPNVFNPFPGPYHPDYLSQNFQTPSDALPFSTVETLDTETTSEQRTTKRRRMSTDSASEPPSSAVSFSSYADSYSGHSSAASHSRRSSMDFPFFASYSIFRGSGNAFWHPPMLAADRSPQFIHPPMLPAEESPMDFLHPPMLPQEEDNLFAAYLHPPMMLPAEGQEAHQPQQHQNQQNQQHQNYAGEGFNASAQAEFYDSAMQTY